jgi:hypothetical protein
MRKMPRRSAQTAQAFTVLSADKKTGYSHFRGKNLEQSVTACVSVIPDKNKSSDTEPKEPHPGLSAVKIHKYQSTLEIGSARLFKITVYRPSHIYQRSAEILFRKVARPEQRGMHRKNLYPASSGQSHIGSSWKESRGFEYYFTMSAS